MGQIYFSEFYALYKDAVDARKSNSKSPHINKVEKECRVKWNEYTNGESKILGFCCFGKSFTDSSVRAAYTSFFLELCNNEEYLKTFRAKGYFYSPDMLLGDKEWEKDFVQVDENEYFHVDCQVFVFLLKAVRAIIDLDEITLLDKCSILYGELDANDETMNSVEYSTKAELVEMELDVVILERILQADNGILFRVEKDAVNHLIKSYKLGNRVDEVYIKRAESALKKLKKCKLI